MANAAAIIKRLDAALTKAGAASDRLMYKRYITETGGDALIGRPGSITHQDVLLNPQPQYSRIGRYMVGNTVPSVMVPGQTTQYVADDWLCIFSPTAMPLADLRNPNLVLVLKDANNNEEVFRVTDFEPVGFQGTDVVFVTYLRSTARPTT